MGNTRVYNNAKSIPCLEAETVGAQFIVHCINSGTNQKYRQFHESSAELWAYSLGIPILEVNASGNDQPVNARSGLIDGKGERISAVPETGEHSFVISVKPYKRFTN
jgi:hypothetical protein